MRRYLLYFLIPLMVIGVVMCSDENTSGSDESNPTAEGPLVEYPISYYAVKDYPLKLHMDEFFYTISTIPTPTYLEVYLQDSSDPVGTIYPTSSEYPSITFNTAGTTYIYAHVHYNNGEVIIFKIPVKVLEATDEELYPQNRTKLMWSLLSASCPYCQDQQNQVKGVRNNGWDYSKFVYLGFRFDNSYTNTFKSLHNATYNAYPFNVIEDSLTVGEVYTSTIISKLSPAKYAISHLKVTGFYDQNFIVMKVFWGQFDSSGKGHPKKIYFFLLEDDYGSLWQGYPWYMETLDIAATDDEYLRDFTYIFSFDDYNYPSSTNLALAALVELRGDSDKTTLNDAGGGGSTDYYTIAGVSGVKLTDTIEITGTHIPLHYDFVSK